jgi:ankyrin repeat protein
MDQFVAARRGNLQQLRVLLTTNNVNEVDGTGWTSLLYAAGNGYVECVRWCLQMGANVNTPDSSGWTPIHMALDHYDVVRLLLDAGATVDAANEVGWTPLYSAIFCSCFNVARLLIDRGGKVSNVKLDEFNVVAIPDWVNKCVESRSNCRLAAVTIIGIHKYRLSNVTGNNDINVSRLIGKHIWSTRMDIWS